ncbi:MAG: hypothetical protein KKA28_02795 [Planctomycetes bacterium]|nr:hypothetical protein [Planctomycetota bacterium]MCG2684787.1 hypothetical protein [Planctomycetales bacterium]
MPQPLHDIVKFRGDRLFNGAVNIDWFGTDEARARLASGAFIFHGPTYHGVSQADVGTTHGHRLQDTAGFARSVVRRCYGFEDQPFTLAIAGYGTGKSHLGLTLASLLSNPQGKTARSVLGAIDTADQAIGSEIRAILQEAGQPCLVVALNGMQSFDLTTEVTQQIIRQVKASGLETCPLDELRPRFSQAVSLVRMANQDILRELVTACDIDSIDVVLAGLEKQDDLVYGRVHDVFAARGMAIAALRGESMHDIIDVSVREYCGKGKPYRTILILFDEFGRYTEFATVRSQIAGSGVLQDLFEGIQANGNAACFAGFIQFELNAYVQRVAPEYKNEILRYVTRYQAANRVYLSINLETLIANLLEKRKPENLNHWLDNLAAKKESEEIAGNLASWFPQSRNHRLWGDPEQFHAVIRKGCWPLSPYSTWFLFHLAAAGKHLQERSALALLGDAFDRFTDSSVPDDGNCLLAPADFWCDALQQDLISSEESGQQGSIAHAYASVDARHGAGLPDDLRRLLRAVVLASKMGLQATDRGDAVEALSRLAGLDINAADRGLRFLQDEYNVLEWDEAFKEFDILGDAVPRTQFLSFVRQRVASTYDEVGKAALFASKASTWCDLLSDMECDFAEENKITTREWRYEGVTSNLDFLHLHLKHASDRWQIALGVDEPRGTIIYCYVEPSRDSAAIDADVRKLLKSAAREAGVSALPILVVLLCDEEGTLGEALAELAVLDESVSEEDRVRFGNLIPAHKEKMRQVLRSQIETMIKQRRYITSLQTEPEAHRLSPTGTELFSQIYRSPVTFPFDGFSTAKGNAADSCQELTTELLLGKLEYDAVINKPTKLKNRAVTVLKDAWGIFAQNGKVRTRPSHPVVRTLTEKWDSMLATGERRLPLGQALRQLCMPPHGANIASAGLLLGTFVAPRVEKLIVVRDGQQYAISQWVQDGVFRGKFIDINALRDVNLVSLGEESSEWEILLDDWEQAENYTARAACLERATELKTRVPIPPALVYRELHLEEIGRTALTELADMGRKQEDAFSKLESGSQRRDVSLLTWGAATLRSLCHRMSEERPLWDEHQAAELEPHIDRARQAIIQCFPEWLARQTPRDGTPDVVGEFKHKMLRLVGGNLQKLELDTLCQKLEKRVGQIVRDAETAVEARQLIRDVRSWLTAHRDAHRVVRVADSRALLEVGKEYATKLQGMSQRIQMPDIGEVRTQLAESLGKIKDAIEQIVKRASRLWKQKLRSEEDLEVCLVESDALTTAFENCPNDLRDLQVMRRALRIYREDHKQLADDRLSWPAFESLAEQLRKEAEGIVDGKEIPWPPGEVIGDFVTSISKRRKESSTAWIGGIEAEAATVSSMSAADANRLHVRASAPPSVLTEPHAKRLEKVLKEVETRLDALKIDWLVEKFKELPVPLRKKFLQIVAGVES